MSCRHDPLTGGQQLSVEQQFLGRSFLAVGVDSDLDLHLAVQVGAGGQDDALRGGEDPLLAGLPKWTVDVLGGAADLHLVVEREHPKAAGHSHHKASLYTASLYTRCLYGGGRSSQGSSTSFAGHQPSWNRHRRCGCRFAYYRDHLGTATDVA